VAFAREHQITQIVFGARRLTRLEELRRGSAVRRLLREAAEAGIDVHVIARNGHRAKENGDGAKE
jgi:K+-sensing histidine kinase KdpD